MHKVLLWLEKKTQMCDKQDLFRMEKSDWNISE